MGKIKRNVDIDLRNGDISCENEPRDEKVCLRGICGQIQTMEDSAPAQLILPFGRRWHILRHHTIL